MVTKSKTPAKKAVKELNIKEDTYCTFINEDGVQDVGAFENYYGDLRFYTILNNELDTDYSYLSVVYPDTEDGDETTFDQEDFMSEVTEFKILTETQAQKLKAQLEKLYFNTGDYDAVPYKKGKEEGYIFGCGKVKLTLKEISEFLKIRKMLIKPDLSKEKGFASFTKVNNSLGNEGSEVEDDIVLELCKRFKI